MKLYVSQVKTQRINSGKEVKSNFGLPTVAFVFARSFLLVRERMLRGSCMLLIRWLSICRGKEGDGQTTIGKTKEGSVTLPFPIIKALMEP